MYGAQAKAGSMRPCEARMFEHGMIYRRVGLMRATIKRDIDTKKLNEIIDDIEVELRSRTLTAVTSHELGDMVLKRLAKIDKVAYIRFASVYRDFKDVDEFLQELDKLR